ncbi:MAG: hypothetical protein R3C05_18030 [Pirellulaceae bacterium]
MKRYLTGLALVAWMTVMVGCAPEAPEVEMDVDTTATEPAGGMEDMPSDSNITGDAETIAAPEVPVVEETPAEEPAPAAEAPAEEAAPAAEAPAEEAAPAAEAPAEAEKPAE